MMAAMRHTTFLIMSIFLFMSLIGCERPSPTATIITAPNTTSQTPPPPPNATPTRTTASDQPTRAATATTTPSPTRTITPTPFYTGTTSTLCGETLPLLPANTEPTTTALIVDPLTRANIIAQMPETAVPAFQQLLNDPANVGLVAYQLGDEANAVTLNADTPMPLASVVKIIHLVAYAEAVAAGELDPTSYVTLADLERFYLPGYDLGAHQNALDDLAEQGLILANPDRIRLEDVPYMMMRYSSNAATDYLHHLLGQDRIEQTAVSLNLTTHTAPCPFIGQFLTMANHMRPANSRSDIIAYLGNPDQYAQDVTQLTDAFREDAIFRADELLWRSGRRNLPSVQVQAYFSENINAHASASDYANLLLTIAQNGLSSPESSFLARRYLEWPMRFPVNQTYFTNLGYKNGSLPGVLTTAYYAYRQGDLAPLVVILFYHNLPNRTYQTWRWQLPHDEFARWLLMDPDALALLRTAVSP